MLKSSRIQSIPKKSERRLVEYFVVISSLRRDRHKDTNSVLQKSGGQKTDGSGFEPSIPEPLGSDIDNVYEPVVTSRYPLKNHRGNPLSESVTCFCHPRGIIRPKYQVCLPKVHYFVMTGERGAQLYGTCLTMYEPVAILSSLLTSNDGDNGYEMKDKDKEPKNHETEEGRACDDDEMTTMYMPKCICILSVHPYLVAFREYLTQLQRLAASGQMKLPIERFVQNFCSEIPAPPPGSFEVQTTILDSVIKFWSPPNSEL